MNLKYYPPEHKQTKFHCPICNVYAAQTWLPLKYTTQHGYVETDMEICICYHCRESSYWHKKTLILPSSSLASMPHSDMPEEIKTDYIEAREIVNDSPRGAAALLRLALQKLMKELGEEGKDINKDIGSLVKKGLPVEIQQALDIVRVIGNESVHPGTLDLKDNQKTAIQLFELINFIIEDRITRKKKINDLFNQLPQAKKDGIAARDR